MNISIGELFLLIFIIIIGTSNLLILLFVLKGIKQLLNRILATENELIREGESLVRAVKPRRQFKAQGLDRNERNR